MSIMFMSMSRLAPLVRRTATPMSINLEHIKSSVFPFHRRTLWQEVVREYKDDDGNVNQEKLEYAGNRAERAEAAEGIDDRHKKYLYYEKPTSRRKRVKEELAYRVKKTKVMELVRYIKFKNEGTLN
mmetsp:Transcript_1649/g.2475  ORF Transcript_1649/g.2475 Transcript_1649/m.2475 type:complete len:127 (-) Transcript_1649:234-614(-)|eukprot:CAMPEP_0195530032 /NCGR_PEP_ID=MMETSP0794_2-20130614/32754_1 /TAXON_ID=515487 /ORGANISM="Stephanopyxis turris, Strain CCMP 815" /LENGTH=126 /DNA_ID=CAMNT_0040661435 /DNA_START=52 /DNA_END=432 /DNA_ORIENTATION=+